MFFFTLFTSLVEWIVGSENIWREWLCRTMVIVVKIYNKSIVTSKTCCYKDVYIDSLWTKEDDWGYVNLKRFSR